MRLIILDPSLSAPRANSGRGQKSVAGHYDGDAIEHEAMHLSTLADLAHGARSALHRPRLYHHRSRIRKIMVLYKLLIMRAARVFRGSGTSRQALPLSVVRAIRLQSDRAP
jgi:hypothetical protein